MQKTCWKPLPITGQGPPERRIDLQCLDLSRKCTDLRVQVCNACMCRS